MREIKFRAWDKERKTMVEVTEVEWMHGGIEVGIEYYEGENHKYAEYGLSNDMYVLMQYTGLKDKNGKESYFDDIAKDVNGVFIVKWFKGNVIRLYKDLPSDMNWIALGTNIPFEIIGNIYENPELLQKADT